MQCFKLGPVLYVIFLSPLFDISELSSFAGDTFIPKWNKLFSLLVKDLEKELESIAKYIHKSGLQVNHSKTEACLLYKFDYAKVEIKVDDSKKLINITGLIFESKSMWSEQVASTIAYSIALNALKLIRNFF